MLTIVIIFVCAPCSCLTLSTISSSLQHFAVLVGVLRCWSGGGGGVVEVTGAIL